MDRPLRDEAFARIYIGQFDNSGSAAAEVSAEATYSDADTVLLGTPVETSYLTWAGNGLTGDGAQTIIPQEGFLNQGFVSRELSGANGAFLYPPTLDFSFSAFRNMVGLTLSFDTVRNEFPAEIVVEHYRRGALVGSETVSPDGASIAPELYIRDTDRVVVRVTKTRLPFQSVTVTRVLFGIGYSYTGNDILSLNIDESSDPISLSLPTCKMTFVLKNIDAYFNPEIPDSRIDFLAEEQEVICETGIKTAEGAEFVPFGTWYLRTWDTRGINATFNAGTVLDRLIGGTYEKDVYDPSSTIGDKLRSIVDDSGIARERFVFPYDADEIACAAPIPIMNHATAIQLIANYGGYQMRIDRAGRFIMFRTNAVEDFTATPSSPPTNYSKAADIGKEAETVYLTWERDFFRGDGKQLVLPEGGYLNNGWVSKLVAADENDTVSIVMTTHAGYVTDVYSLEMDFGLSIPQRMTVYKNTGTVNSPVWTFIGAYRPVSYQQKFNIHLIAVAQFRIDLLEPMAYPGRYHIANVNASYVTPFTISSERERARVFHPIYSKRISRFRLIRIPYYFYNADAAVSEIATASVTQNGTIRIEHGPAVNQSANIDLAGASVSVASYSHVTYITVSGIAGTLTDEAAANVTLLGNLIDVTESVREIAVNPTGDTLELVNPLYGEATVDLLSGWTGKYASGRVEQVFDMRGEAQVEIGDYIHLDDDIGIVTERKYSHTGADKDSMTVRRGSLVVA